MTRLALKLSLLALVPLLLSSAYGAPKARSLANVEVIIVRHAEREGIFDLLTPAGKARASAYADYFKNLSIDGRPIHLTHLFAEQSKRTRNTLDPLAKATSMPLDTRFSTEQSPELVQDLKTHSYGDEILICWHHSSIAKLITALGGDPAVIPNGKWPKSKYDWLVDLRFDASGNVSLASEKLVHEHLMPGDEK